MQAMRGRLALTLLILLAAAARPASYARGTLHVCVARTGGPLALRGGQGAHSSGRSASSGGRDDGQNATADEALYTDSEAEASDTILERSMRGTGRSDMETLRHLEQEFRGQLSSLQSGANPTGHSGGSTQEGRAGAQGLASMLAGGSVGLDPGVAARLDREHQELFGMENPLRFLSSDRQQQRNLASQLQTEILEAGVGETAPPVVDDGPRDSDDSSDPRQRHTTSDAKAPHDVGAREAEDHIDIQTGEDAVHDVVESGADAGGDADMAQSDDSEAASAAAWGSSRDDSTSLSRDSLLSMPGPDDQPIRDDKSSGRDQARSVAVARRRRGVGAGASLMPAAWNASEVQDMTDKACISLPTGEEQGYKGYGAAAKRASAQRPVCSSTHTKAQVLDDREDAMLVEEEAGAAWAAWEGQEGQEVDVAVEEALLKEAEEQPGDIIVPDMHNNVPEAVLLAHDKAYGMSIRRELRCTLMQLSADRARYAQAPTPSCCVPGNIPLPPTIMDDWRCCGRCALRHSPARSCLAAGSCWRAAVVVCDTSAVCLALPRRQRTECCLIQRSTSVAAAAGVSSTATSDRRAPCPHSSRATQKSSSCAPQWAALCSGNIATTSTNSSAPPRPLPFSARPAFPSKSALLRTPLARERASWGQVCAVCAIPSSYEPPSVPYLTGKPGPRWSAPRTWTRMRAHS